MKKTLKIGLLGLLFASSLKITASEIIFCDPPKKISAKNEKSGTKPEIICYGRLEAGQPSQKVSILDRGANLVATGLILKLENSSASIKLVERRDDKPVLKGFTVVIHDDSGKSDLQKAAAFSFSDEK